MPDRPPAYDTSLDPFLIAVESVESWVHDSPVLREKRERLLATLAAGSMAIVNEKILMKVIRVAAYSPFRANIVLLQALAQSMANPGVLLQILKGPAGPGTGVAVIQWRLRYLLVLTTLSRVFAPDRLDLVIQVLRRVQRERV